MKKIILLVAVLTLALLKAFGANETIKNGNESFEIIISEGSANIHISQSDTYSIEVIDMTEDKVCKTSVKNGVLYIKTLKRTPKDYKKEIDVYITCPYVKEITRDGIGVLEFTSNFVIDNDLNLIIDGVGKTTTHNITCKNLTITHDGVGVIDTEIIDCDKFSMKHDGVGQFKATKIDCIYLDITHSGVGNISFRANCDDVNVASEGTGSTTMDIECENLNITNEGIGNVNISGKAVSTKIQKEGIGNVDTSNLIVGK